MSFDFSVTLFRDSLYTPWGFRLEGGRDYQTPLTIQRVFTGSPASSELQRGDTILAIQNRDASYLLHKEADDLIRNSGGSINLTIRRSHEYFGPNVRHVLYRPLSTLFLAPTPVYRSAITNYNNKYAHLFSAEDPLSSYVRSRPIEKTKDPRPILSQTGSPIMPGGTPHFSTAHTTKRYRPTSTMPLFSSLPTTDFSGHNHADPNATSATTYGTVYHPHTNTNYTATPYSDKRMVSQIQQSLTRAANNTRYNRSHTSAPAVTHHVIYPPSLPNYYEDHHQFSPSYVGGGLASSEYLDPAPSKGPIVKNLQYNSPIGLYSKDNIREELNKQVGSGHQFQPASEF